MDSEGEIETRLSLEVEKELLRVLQDPLLGQQKFGNICDTCQWDDGSLIFGDIGTLLRRKVQIRRDYLLRRPKAFERAVRELLSPSRTDCSFHSPSKSAIQSVTERSRRRATMATSTDNRGNNNFQLFPNEPWMNPNGIICLEIQDLRADNSKKIVTKLRILKHIPDVKDIEKGRYSAKLSATGDGIFATEPAQPDYLACRDNVDAITACIEGENVCDQTKAVYEAVTTAMKKNVDLRSREVIYAFPKGMTCNNKSFNDESDGTKPNDDFELKTTIAFDVRFGRDRNPEDLQLASVHCLGGCS